MDIHKHRKNCECCQPKGLYKRRSLGRRYSKHLKHFSTTVLLILFLYYSIILFGDGKFKVNLSLSRCALRFGSLSLKEFCWLCFLCIPTPEKMTNLEKLQSVSQFGLVIHLRSRFSSAIHSLKVFVSELV